MREREKKLAIFGFFFVAALLSVVGLFDVGHQYGDYRLLYGMGTSNITSIELIFYLWYFLFGTLAVGFLAVALLKTSALPKWEKLFDQLLACPLFVPMATTLLLGEILLFQSTILQYAPIADDEATYAFIAKTLLNGRLVNPSPGDIDFFTNQFVVLNESAWYGKYPIGHPLLLTLGEAVNLRFLVVPLITCITFVITYLVGRQIFTHKQACLGLCLLLASPHFVFMAACELSHPTASLFMMLGLWSLLKIDSQSSPWWPILVGGFFGYGLIVRPFPGCLFIAAAGMWVLFGTIDLSKKQRLWSLLIGAVPIVLAGLFLFWVNQVQTGDALQSGYHVVHGPSGQEAKGASLLSSLGLFKTNRGVIGASVGGALVRQNFWLFGWPISLVFVLFARSRFRLGALWGMILAAYVYRIIVPKTVVATLGPVYMTEIVPLLALASASGMVSIRQMISESSFKSNKHLVSAVAVSAVIITSITFLPVQLREMKRSSTTWQAANRLVEKVTKGKVLIFANGMVDPIRGNSWAYHPPNPSPDLDDKVIFVRNIRGKDGAKRNIEFWKRRFPDRSAWQFAVGREGAFLKKIETVQDFDRSASDPF